MVALLHGIFLSALAHGPMIPATENQPTTEMGMALNNIPPEIIDNILAKLCAVTTPTEFYRFRAVSRQFKLHINRLCVQRNIRPPIIRDRRYRETPVSGTCIDRSRIHAEICAQLLARGPGSKFSRTALILRDATMILSKSVAFGNSDHSATASPPDSGTVTPSVGEMSECANARFLKICSAVASTVIAYEDLDQLIGLPEYFKRDTRGLFWNIDGQNWAETVAVYLQDLSLLAALLSEYNTLDDQPGLWALERWRAEGNDGVPDGDDADLYYRGEFGLTASLYMAVRLDNVQAATMILKHKADPEFERQGAYGTVGETPLEVACQNGSSQMVYLLLQSDWELICGGVLHQSAIICAAQCRCSEGEVCTYKQRISIIDSLSKRSSDMKVDLDNILQQACRWGCRNIVDIIISRGAKVNHPPSILFQPRRTLSASLDKCLRKLGFVHLLLEEHWNLPLAIAASHGHIEVMELLLMRGALPIWPWLEAYSVPFHRQAASAAMLHFFSEHGSDLLWWQTGFLSAERGAYLLRGNHSGQYPRTAALLVDGGYRVQASDSRSV